MKKLLKNIGNHIREFRLSQEKGQTEVAKALGISVAALSKIENGLTDLNLSRLIQIAQYFEVTITALIYGTAESLINVPAADDEELNSLKSKLLEKDIELMELQKKVIQLYEKLGL